MLFLYIGMFLGGAAATCNSDNCLRAFQNGGGFAANSQFCSSFLATTYTATASGLGPFSTQCKNLPSRVSSACSCLMTTTSSSSKTTSSTSPTLFTGSSTPTVTITATMTATCSTTGLPSTGCSAASTVTTTVSVAGVSPTCSSPPASTLTVTSISLSTTTTTVTATAQPTCPQLILNGGFESGDLTDWTNTFDNQGTEVIIATSLSIPGGAHSGSYAAAVVELPNGLFLPAIPTDWYQTITVPSQLCSPTQQYLFQAFVKTVGNTCYVNAYDNESGMSFVSIMLQPGGAVPPWVEISALITPGVSPFSLVMETSCDTMDTVWFDDISLSPVS